MRICATQPQPETNGRLAARRARRVRPYLTWLGAGRHCATSPGPCAANRQTGSRVGARLEGSASDSAAAPSSPKRPCTGRETAGPIWGARQRLASLPTLGLLSLQMSAAVCHSASYAPPCACSLGNPPQVRISTRTCVKQGSTASAKDAARRRTPRGRGQEPQT